MMATAAGRSRRRALQFALVLCAAPAAAPAPAMAQQYYNILHPADEIEQRLGSRPFTVVDWRGARAEGDRTQRALLSFEDSVVMLAQWATAPVNGEAFNNEPRYEAAAYEIQKLFLDEPEYVVPPTVLRALPIAFVREQIPGARPTFREAPGSVVVALQYWLIGVTPQNYWDPQRANTDDLYARHIGNLNILTYLIRHSDANVGNFLISDAADDPRVFAVDNGVAFRSPESNRGAMWRDLQVKRLPRHTVERLRRITREELERTLAVLQEYEIHDGQLVPVVPGPNPAPSRGVRRSRERIQFGLTAREIREVESRLRQLVRQVDAGRIALF
jgi:hypothetical protein